MVPLTSRSARRDLQNESHMLQNNGRSCPLKRDTIRFGSRVCSAMRSSSASFCRQQVARALARFSVPLTRIGCRNGRKRSRAISSWTSVVPTEDIEVVNDCDEKVLRAKLRRVVVRIGIAGMPLLCFEIPHRTSPWWPHLSCTVSSLHCRGICDRGQDVQFD